MADTDAHTVHSTAHKTPHRHHTRSRRKLKHPAAAAALSPPEWGVLQGGLLAGIVSPAPSTYTLTEWDGQISTLDEAAHAFQPVWSTVLLNGTQLLTACRQHWLRPLDTPTSCGLPAGESNLALAWDRSRLTSAPDWSDFWDIARKPGRRGLYFGARTTLEVALLADGVEPHNIYAVLSSPAGVERAFHKLDLLRPYIIWWRTPEDARQIIRQSSALMICAPVAEIMTASSRDNVQSASSVFIPQTQHLLKSALFWTIPVNNSERNAQETLNTLKKLHTQYNDMPDNIAHTRQNTLTIDDTFWQDNAEPLEKRFLDWFGASAP